MVGVLCLENYGRFQYMAKTTHVSVTLYENNLYTETTTGFTYWASVYQKYCLTFIYNFFLFLMICIDSEDSKEAYISSYLPLLTLFLHNVQLAPST